MVNLKGWAALLSMLVSITGCVMISVPSRQPFAGLPYRYNSFDLKVAWKAEPTRQGLALDGVLKNVRYARMDDLDVTVSLLDPRQGIFAKAKTFVIPRSANLDEYRNFDMVLENATLKKGDMFRFDIHYVAVDDHNSTLNWYTTFTVDAETGATVLKSEGD